MEEEQQFEQEAQELLEKKQYERQQRKGQRKSAFMRAFLRFITFILLVAGVLYVLTLDGWYLPVDTFKTCSPQRILIYNNKIVKTQKIKSVIKDVKPIKVPIFLLSFNRLKKEILSLSSVEDVYIRRYAFPARVVIILREAVPVITISPDVNVKPVAAFTKDGRIISGNDYLPLPAGYNTLLVLSYGNKGDDYRKWDAKKIDEIEQIADFVKSYTGEAVEYVDLRNPEDIYVKVTSFLIRVGKNDASIRDRIQRLPSILPEAEKVKSKIKYIDIRWDNVNYLKMK